MTSPGMFLETEELKRMTGARSRRLQKEWLRTYRIPFTEARTGRINILRAYVEKTHGMKDVTAPVRVEPDVDCFKRQALEYQAAKAAKGQVKK